MVWLRVPYSLSYHRPQSDCGRQNEHSQSHGQEDFPSYLHELVKAVTWERATIPDIEVHEPSNFEREPINILNSNTDVRDKENQPNQPQHCAKSRETDGLNTKERMPGHTGRVIKA